MFSKKLSQCLYIQQLNMYDLLETSDRKLYISEDKHHSLHSKELITWAWKKTPLLPLVSIERFKNWLFKFSEMSYVFIVT